MQAGDIAIVFPYDLGVAITRCISTMSVACICVQGITTNDILFYVAIVVDSTGTESASRGDKGKHSSLVLPFNVS
jgi:hypothetical protein